MTATKTQALKVLRKLRLKLGRSIREQSSLNRKEEKMGEGKIILGGCEVGCIPVESELIACPLSEEEVRKCPRRLGYLAGIREVVEWIEQRVRVYPVGYGMASVFTDKGWQAKLKE